MFPRFGSPRFGFPRFGSPQHVQQSAFEQQPIPGVPSVFTGRDATVGEMRQMATKMAETDYSTSTEKGLALSILAILDMFEAQTSQEV